MSLDVLKREAAALDSKSQRELFSYLASLREERWIEHLREAGKVLDDPNPDRWLTAEEFKARLDRIPEPEGE